MWGLGIFVVLFGVVWSLMSDSTGRARAEAVRADARVIAGSMMVYRNYVVPYAAANTGANGTAADAALTLPSWYVRVSGVTNYVAAGKAYVYYPTASGDLPMLITNDLAGSLSVGTKQGGYLINPLVANAAPTSLPAAIPEGSVVIAP